MTTPAFSRTALVDRLVSEAAQQWLDLSLPYALVAVGGYGRGELFPFSDVDLLFLVRAEADLTIKEPLGRFLSALWDSSVKVSHSVRTIDECLRLQAGNPHLSISLLDARFISGEQTLFEDLKKRLPAFFHKQKTALLRSLADLTQNRHAKFDHTVYHLEPNVKDGPGGIRDYHLLHWATQLDPDRELFRQALHDADSAHRFLYPLRAFLHERSGRDNNLLSFEMQDEAASPLAPELWMRTFYREARTCLQCALQVLDSIERRDSGLVRQFFERRDKLSTPEFTVSNNQVFLRNPSITLRSTRSLLDLFLFVGRQGIPLAWDTQRRLKERAAELDESSLDWAGWRKLLSLPHAALTLRHLHECGILSRILPVWHRIDSLVVRDFYHRYTVDEHTLVALETFDRLLENQTQETGRFQELAREENDPALLRLAILLHDTGKGSRPGEHVTGSMETAARFLAHRSAPENDRHTVEFLIGNHLVLSSVMTGRDLDDPATARFLSKTTSTYEDLRRLTLLTYADVSAVNPTALTAWRAEQLWRVYMVARSQLTRDLAADRIGSHQQAVPVHRFLEGFPTRYLRVHSSEQIAEHLQLEESRRGQGIALAIQREPGAYALTVLAADREGLFASLCGALASFGMNIMRAEAASNRQGIALDEFRFTDPTRTLELNPEERDRLQITIKRVVQGAVEVRELLRGRRPVQRPYFSARVQPALWFDDAASDSATLLHFTGEDRPGLLFDLASTLTGAGCNIELVLVDTEGHRARDVFYVTEAGRKLSPETQAALQAQLTP